LKATLERGVLFNILPVFVQGRGAYGVEFAPRERRL